MAIYIYRKAPSNGAIALAQALEGKKVQRLPRRIIKQDLIICWGSELQDAPCKILNGAVLKSKLTDARILSAAGVPTIEVANAPREGYVGRVNNHVEGRDLITPPERPDFWVKKEEFKREFRVHSFGGVTIRAGVKIPRSGVEQPHPWVRSRSGGWRISYDAESIRQRHRDVAHAAIKALGLDFGAVDIGERRDKTLVVLEVNRAPGIEGGTIGAYVKAINKWRTK